MVTLTNSTTSTPSVSGVAVIGVSQTNQTPALPLQDNIPVPTTEFGVSSSVSNSISYNTEDRIYGPAQLAFPGGVIVSIFAYLDPTGTVTGKARGAIYLDGSLINESEVVNFDSVSGGARWVEFLFSNPVKVGAGLLSIGVLSNCEMRLESDGSGVGTQAIISSPRSYADGFPTTFRLAYTGNRQQCYVRYYDVGAIKTIPLGVSWGDLMSDWNSNIKTWDSYTDITSISNI